jgi:hypothetical protein
LTDVGKGERKWGVNPSAFEGAGLSCRVCALVKLTERRGQA